MQTLQTDPGVYGTTLPKFESCVDVKTSVNNGIFYIDVFALNASQLVAFSADVAFTTGKMQIMQADVKKLLAAPPQRRRREPTIQHCQIPSGTPAKEALTMTDPATTDPACSSASRHRLSRQPGRL